MGWNGGGMNVLSYRRTFEGFEVRRSWGVKGLGLIDGWVVGPFWGDVVCIDTTARVEKKERRMGGHLPR